MAYQTTPRLHTFLALVVRVEKKVVERSANKQAVKMIYNHVQTGGK